MCTKEKIITNVEEIKSTDMLDEIFEFIQIIKEKYLPIDKGSKEEVMKFAGILSNEDAEEMTSIINKEFNNIEGDC